MKKSRRKRLFPYFVLSLFLILILFNSQFSAADSWEAYSFQAGQIFQFELQQTEPADILLDFLFEVTAPKKGQLLAEISGKLDMGFMELPLYISATGPDDAHFADSIFQALLDDFMGWILLSFFSPSLFLLDIPSVTMASDDTGEWMDIPVMAQSVPLEAGYMERSVEIFDEDGNFVDLIQIQFEIEEATMESFDRVAGEVVTFSGYKVSTNLGIEEEEKQSIYAEIFIAPELPLPLQIFFRQVMVDADYGTQTTEALMRIAQFVMP